MNNMKYFAENLDSPEGIKDFLKAIEGLKALGIVDVEGGVNVDGNFQLSKMGVVLAFLIDSVSIPKMPKGMNGS